MDQKLKKTKQKNTSTLLRQWELLCMLRVSEWDDKNLGRWDKASEITEKLNDRGYDVQLRTVQRDLLQLMLVFPIERNDKNPRDYGWRWEKGGNLHVRGLGASEALAMRLVEMQLTQQLPESMLDGLRGLFAVARKKLDDLEKTNNPRAKSWLSKVRVVQATQALLPPALKPDVQSEIYRALLENLKIAVVYANAEGSSEKEMELNPLGIILRGSVTYLVATAWKFTDPRLYALHRFNQVEVLGTATQVPRGFSLDKVIQEGFADFELEKETMQIVLRCQKGVAHYLGETRLSEDQCIGPIEDDWCQLTATVNNTRQLRWWILGQGAGIEVCSPPSLRDDIKAELLEASRLYS